MILKPEKSHLWAVLFLAVCTTGYLFDVLFLDRHLSAFDIFLDAPSWKAEFGDIRPHNTILADSPTAHYPYKREFWDSARQGYNTQYLPHIFTGKPTVGEGVGATATSVFQFFMDIPNALDWSTWLRLLLAAVLMYAFLVLLGAGSVAAVLGSIAWTYNMHQIAWLMFPHHLATQLWLPLMLTLNILLLRDRSNLAAAIGLVLSVVYFFTSGYIQIVFYGLIYIGLFNVLYLFIVQRGPALERLRTWAWVQALFLVAGLVLLPEALWQGQEIAEGLRGTQDFRYRTQEFDLSFASLGKLVTDLLPRSTEVTRLFMPNYGSDLGQAPAIKHFFKSNAVEYQVFFGLVCLYLCLLGLIKTAVKRDRQLVLFAVLLFLCIGLMNGNGTLIALMNLVPFGGAGSFARIVTLVIFTAAVFVSFGARFLVEDLSARRYAPAGAAFALMMVWLGAVDWKLQDELLLREFVPWIVYLGVFLALSLGLARFDRARFIVPVAVILTLVELLLAGYRFNNRLESRHHFPENATIRHIRGSEGFFRTALLMKSLAYHHNIFTYYDLSTIGGYSTVVPSDYVFFMRKAYENVQVTLNGIMFLYDGNIPILRLLNTRYIVSDLPLDSPLISPVYSNDVETLYEFNDPLARAYCASHQIVNEERGSIPGQVAELVSRYDRPVVVEKQLVEGEELTEGCKVSGLNALTSKLAFSVETDQPSVVFVPVNYHDYWRARIDGEAVRIHRGNHAFMSIAVPAGESSVELEFVNTKLTVGAVLYILLGITGIAVALIRVGCRWQQVLIVLCGTFLVGRSLMSIPGIMNMDIPERTGPEPVQTRQTTGG